MITKDYLLNILDYNPETGIFTPKPYKWVKRVTVKYPQTRNGVMDNDYVNISVRNPGTRRMERHGAHRLAMLILTGEWPAEDLKVDHENRIKYDNRGKNLRILSHSHNKLNEVQPRADNKTGVRGVSFNKNRQRYEAYIHVDKKRKHLGQFNTLEEAAQAYADAKELYYPGLCKVNPEKCQ